MVVIIETQKKLETMYEQGDCSGIVEEISQLKEEKITVDIRRILAWAYFRLGRIEESWKLAKILSSEGDKKSRDIMSQIEAYVCHRDPVHGEELTVSMKNAMAIRARDADSDIPTSVVMDMTFEHMLDEDIAGINLANNTARLLLARAELSKPEGVREVQLAIVLWENCLFRYGENKNYHHRAAVCFWLTKAYEELGRIDLALFAAHRSIRLWEAQAAIDPENKSFKEKLENAYKRLEELVLMRVL